MTRDKTIDKYLVRQKPDEVYPQIVRQKGKLVTLRKFHLFYPVWQTRTCRFVYFYQNKPVTTGSISKSEIFLAMRKLSVQYR